MKFYKIGFLIILPLMLAGCAPKEDISEKRYKEFLEIYTSYTHGWNEHSNMYFDLRIMHYESKEQPVSSHSDFYNVFVSDGSYDNFEGYYCFDKTEKVNFAYGSLTKHMIKAYSLSNNANYIERDKDFYSITNFESGVGYGLNIALDYLYNFAPDSITYDDVELHTNSLDDSYLFDVKLYEDVSIQIDLEEGKISKFTMWQVNSKDKKIGVEVSNIQNHLSARPELFDNPFAK